MMLHRGYVREATAVWNTHALGGEECMAAEKERMSEKAGRPFSNFEFLAMITPLGELQLRCDASRD